MKTGVRKWTQSAWPSEACAFSSHLFGKKQDGRSQEGKTSDIFLQYFILTELRTSVFFSYIYKNEYYVFDFICNLDFFAELKIDWGFLL